ncbi:cation diffusion facilitator family transporter [Salinibacterium sp. SYSU T00001]|uniref:cation diffusion facilitator family transporter n=1 Tax=Homoserinimonas sedimenticola TaxID=2986805 RepID=UPI002235C7AB|nr:cation diffusion facilitator family transporter [Salinibacterium sedimenticola]MCW4384748.1 cation diffusion facilitator family transporter [Salinibacterium sedimenticola]
MGFHDHDHSHEHGVGSANRRRLLIAIVIIAAVLVAEVVGAIVSGSLALLADAGHMLSDLIALVIALVATVVAERPASEKRTFGHRRVEVFAAFVNAGLLAAVVIGVAVEALSRLFAAEGSGVDATPMLLVAILGAAANVIALLVLRAGAKSTINMRAAYLEVLGDLVGSIAVIVSAVVILVTGFTAADAIASLLIVVLILPRVFAILRDVVAVLGQEVPRGTDVTLIREHVLAAPGVVDVHDVHVWAVTPGQNVFSAHVVVEDVVLAEGRASALLTSLDACLADHFDVEHSTFQLEPREHAEREPRQHP